MTEKKFWKLGIIGWPLGYSLSPVMHHAALKACGLQGEYIEYKVKPEDLENWLATVAPALDGFNVTMPYKEGLFLWMQDSIASRKAVLSQVAAQMRAVNTVAVREGGFEGDNTDGIGFVNSLDEKIPAGFDDKKVLIFGAGGAARAVIWALLTKHSGKRMRIYLYNRDPKKAADLCAQMTAAKPVECHSEVQVCSNEERAEALQFDLIVNTTPVGMNPGEGPLFDYGQLRPGQIIYDIVYKPKETALVQAARSRACIVITGDEMLAGQGAAAFEIWTGVPAAKTLPVMKKALEEHFARREKAPA